MYVEWKTSFYDRLLHNHVQSNARWKIHAPRISYLTTDQVEGHESNEEGKP